MTKRVLPLFAACGISLLSAAPTTAATRLFILSGQSNMAGLDPEISFTPEIKKAFPNDEILIVKDAHSGRPIRDWLPNWKGADGTPGSKPKQNGRHYRTLMGKVTEALKDKPPLDSVTFVWMQGEADGKEGGDVYETSLKNLISQVRTDLNRKDVTVVIGRISDCQEDPEKPRPHWETVRTAEVAVAEADPLAEWVDTDDLNGPQDGLHYNKEGYSTLGTRFAEKAIGLINNSPKP